MKFNFCLIVSICMITILACKKTDNDFDATGTFETDEIIISAENTGVLKQFDVEEGIDLKEGQFIGYIDSIQLHLKKKQLQAQVSAVLSKRPDMVLQLAALQEQLSVAKRDQQRIQNLVNAEAAATKKLDDANAQIIILQKQIEAQKSTLGITTEGINKEALPVMIQIEQVNDQLEKCKLINPVNGTVISKYAEENEMTAPGKPLYKIADLSMLYLRAYVTGKQVAEIKISQKVKVLTDSAGEQSVSEGTITWINNKAEFTPKTIQTKDERENMVYAFKVAVKNDGRLKIGMYGEVKFK